MLSILCRMAFCIWREMAQNQRENEQYRSICCRFERQPKIHSHIRIAKFKFRIYWTIISIIFIPQHQLSGLIFLLHSHTLAILSLWCADMTLQLWSFSIMSYNVEMGQSRRPGNMHGPTGTIDAVCKQHRTKRKRERETERQRCSARRAMMHCTITTFWCTFIYHSFF